VALSADGELLVGGGADGSVRLWETTGSRLRANLQVHTGGVWGLALSADGRLLASASLDGAAGIWETSGGTCLRSLRPERLYERLDITRLTGITAAQRAALLTLGAIEQGGGTI
jgi:WD40 repeat protein